MNALFTAPAIVFALIAIFLGKELLKKFGFMRDFVNNSNQEVTWNYGGDDKPGMYNIVLRGEKPFCALVGFTLKIPFLGYEGFDYYGFVQSDQNGVAVISTYLGKGECEFRFFLNTDLEVDPVAVSSSDDDQELNPDSTYPPHWWQQLSFYG